MRTNTVDRSKWQPGTWDDEPDELHFEAHGYPCLLWRFNGHWCGYVGIPAVHPLFGVGTGEESSALKAALARRLERPIGTLSPLAAFCACAEGGPKAEPGIALEAHGGITYAHSTAPMHTEADLPSNRWWFGFDCGHYGDAKPGEDLFGYFEQGVYRTADYAKAETEGLARQLREIDEECAVLDPRDPYDQGEPGQGDHHSKGAV